MKAVKKQEKVLLNVQGFLPNVEFKRIMVNWEIIYPIFIF
jgi:hypothetical protein